MTYDRKEVGNKLRKRRTELGLTQEKVSEMIDRALTFYTRIELGTTGMSVDTLLSLCSALKMRPDEILMEPKSEESLKNHEWIAAAITNCPPEKQEIAIGILKVYLGEK